jgi:hypothetical protein
MAATSLDGGMPKRELVAHFLEICENMPRASTPLAIGSLKIVFSLI